jgi:hypothetical protein
MAPLTRLRRKLGLPSSAHPRFEAFYSATLKLLLVSPALIGVVERVWQSCRSAARRLGVSDASAVRWLQRARRVGDGHINGRSFRAYVEQFISEEYANHLKNSRYAST